MTMRSFTSAELSRMQATQEAAMQCTCVVLVHSAGSADGFGQPASSYAAGDSISCGWKPAPGKEVMGETEAVMIDGELRLPIDTAISSLDRIKVTHRFGADVTDIIYDVIGEPQRGPSGLVVALAKATEE